MQKNKREKKKELVYFLIGRSIKIMFLTVIISFGGINHTFGTNTFTMQADNAQQKKKMTGTVLDKEGNPIIGASVVEEGSSNGTVTNIDGKFSLTLKSEGMIKVSFLGYQTQRIQIKNQQNLLIVLTEDIKSLEEVVVVGYGQVRRKDLTGSIEQIKMDEMLKAPVKSFDDALAGRISGVQVLSADGQPGSSPNIIIRGGNSLTQDNSPLYVIDGFPIENNDNNTLNYNDIESIDILKDASATAIYGARGANGVIMITTKQGRAGAPVINYNAYVGFQNEIKRIEVMDPYEFVRLQLEIDPVGATNLYLTSQERTLEDYKSIQGIDWYDKVTQTAPVQSHNISITGGTNQTKYSFSGSYFEQEGIFINTGYRRYQGRMSLDQTINLKSKIRVTTDYADSKNYGSVATDYDSGQAGASLMTNIWGYRPILANEYGIDAEDELIDPNINPNSVFRVNPLMQLENEFRERINQNLRVNALYEYKITKELVLQLTGSLNKSNVQINIFNNSNTRSGSTYFPFSQGVNGSRTMTEMTNISNENMLTYNKVFNRIHRLTALAVFSQQKGITSIYGASAFKIPNESLGLSGIDEGTPYSITSSISDWALRSYLTRVNYSYRSKLLFTSSFRADGSSKFDKDNRWGYFPSFALAYRFNNEAFIKALKVVSDLKLRTSYGYTGNNRVNDFAYLSNIKILSANGYSFGNQTPSQGSVVSALGNPKLKWETTKQFDAGMDLVLWNGRLTFNGDFYHKLTDDLLLNAQLPNSSGYLRAFKNVGAVSNRGWEFTINSVNIKSRKFSWDTNFNISFNRSKVEKLTDNQTELTSSVTVSGSTNNAVYIARIGEPVAQFYGLIYEGTYKKSDFVEQPDGILVLKEELPANGSVRANIRPGDARYRDLSHDNNITNADYTVIGSPEPDFIGGFTNSFKYKSIDLSIFFQFSYGNEVFNANKVLFENGRTIDTNTNQYAALANRWSEDNPDSDIPAANRLGGNFYSSRSVEDGSYLRLKTLSLGYTLPDKWLKPIRIKSIRFYGAIQNLLTITNYSGMNPDVSTRHSALTPGFDISPYPAVRTTTLGVSITL